MTTPIDTSVHPVYIFAVLDTWCHDFRAAYTLHSRYHHPLYYMFF